MRKLILLFSLMILSISAKAELNSDVVVDTTDTPAEVQYWII